MELERNLKLSLLSEIYKNLLTSKQQKVLKDFLDNNLSMSELATEYNTSRQAINDLLKRTFKMLESYEEKLGMLKKFESIRQEISLLVNEVESKTFSNSKLKEKLNNILEVL